MKKKVMRKCAICGKKFTPKTANALVCSDKCRKALKAKTDKAYRSSKKNAPKKVSGKAIEKVVLPVKKSVKKTLPKKCDKKFDTKITVKNGNPFKLVVLSLLVLRRALNECIAKGEIFHT